MSARRGSASPSARAKQQKARTAAKRRRERAAERAALAAQIEALIDRLDVLDGDADMEDEPEFAGVDPAFLATRGIGDDTDAEDSHDAEETHEDDEKNGDDEDDLEREPSDNAPVSAVYLGLDVTGGAVP